MAIWDIKERNNLARANQHLNKGDRGVFAGGHSGSTNYDVIQYITIASTGDTTDFGDLTGATRGTGGTSNGHGGLS